LTQKKSTKTESAPPGNRHRETLKKWRVVSEALAALVDLEKVNKNGVGAAWEIVTETPSKVDAWIRKRSKPLLT
jgi:hypothetical protein